MTVLDQTRDPNGQHLYGLLNTVDAAGVRLFDQPDYVKAASADAVAGNDSVAPGVYGNPRDRLFPCHTAAATWVSAAFFHTQKAAMDRRTAEVVEARIDRAAAHHGIAGHVAAVKAAVARTAPRAEADLPDADFALVAQFPDGRAERALPIRNAAEVKAAAAHLERYAADYTFDDRAVIADKILEKAAAYGVDLGEAAARLEKRAGRGSSAPATVAELLFSRAQAVRVVGRDLAMAEGLAKMAVACLTDPEAYTLPSTLRKVAGFVDRVDREYKLLGLSTLARPEDVLFRVTVKAAEQTLADHVSLTSGSIYAKAALARVPLGEVRAVMGDGFADAVSAGGLFVDTEKLAQVAPTMPRDDAELFDRLAARFGVRPAHKEAAHAGAGPLAAPGALAALAALHQPPIVSR